MTDGLVSQIDIVLESEIASIGRVVDVLNHSVAFTPRTPEDATREIIERFYAINFNVSVLWEMDAAGFSRPTIQINSRVDGKEFDHDQMRHEVQNDILGLDGPGAIGRDGKVISPAKSVGQFDKKG